MRSAFDPFSSHFLCFFLITGIALILLVYAPSLWIRYILWRYSKTIEGLPGTGGELAQHLVDKFALDGVTVVRGNAGDDFYAPDSKTVSLSPAHYDRKSLAAVAVAAHEVGHAIQFYRKEPVSQLRERYLKHAFRLRQLGGYILMATPVVMLLVRSPAVLLGFALIAIATMLLSALMYVAILPEEFDASFNKAMPILQQGYLPDSMLPGARSVLQAAAMTYVASALADVLSLWRWIRFLR